MSKPGADFRQGRAQGVLRFAPLGIATTIIADDSTLLEAATANFTVLADSQPDSDAKLVIRLHWNALATAKVGFSISAKGSRLTLEGEGIFGWADAATGQAECTLSRAYGAAGSGLSEIGETLLLFLLTRSGRAPLHASAVMIGETAVLLAGRSGCGKSSLALAAQRNGLRVLSEDTTYVQLEPSLRLWGWPGAIHLDPAEAPSSDLARRLRGGKIKAAVPRTSFSHSAERGVLVVLTRGRSVALGPLAAGAAVTELAPAEPGFDLLRPQIEAALRTLAEPGAWRLTLSGDPAEAIALLRERFA